MINVAIVGFGTVGSGTAEVLSINAERIKSKLGEEIYVKYICDLRDFPGSPYESRLIKDYHIALNDPEISIVAEVMGGAGVAYEMTKQALAAKKSVVTSNKEVVALHGPELLRLAEEHGVRYLFEASVGGGIPLLRPIAQCLAANELDSIYGILNGTCNYILSQMEKYGKDFSLALKEAQQKGYAEKDPTNDIEGYDTRRKICILTALMTGKLPSAEDVPTKGVTDVNTVDIEAADKHKLKIKLIGSAKKIKDGVCVEVAPCCVPTDYPLYNITDVFNGVVVNGNATDEVMFFGKGAGKMPTASAVVSDMIDIAMHKNSRNAFGLWENAPKGYVRQDHSAARYLIRTSSSILAGKLICSGGKVERESDGTLSLITAPIDPVIAENGEIVSRYKIIE